MPMPSQLKASGSEGLRLMGSMAGRKQPRQPYASLILHQKHTLGQILALPNSQAWIPTSTPYLDAELATASNHSFSYLHDRARATLKSPQPGILGCWYFGSFRKLGVHSWGQFGSHNDSYHLGVPLWAPVRKLR